MGKERKRKEIFLFSFFLKSHLAQHLAQPEVNRCFLNRTHESDLKVTDDTINEGQCVETQVLYICLFFWSTSL